MIRRVAQGQAGGGPLGRKVELLAPAGRPDALEAVVAAGADAVYLGPKRWNMRMHRGDFHFTDEQIAAAAEMLHARGRRLYVTVNNLLSDEEVARIGPFLHFLAEAGADAVIVQDLAMLAVLRRERIGLPVHASTMLNVHCAAMARALRRLGVTRIITSRDISIAQAGAIGRAAGVEIEYFVHGDMCVAQSGQCTLSGVALGKSANRGECMKPCRWGYDLVTLGANGRAGEVLASVAEGHLLAVKDLALLRSLPAMVAAGIVSLKIEGRMRDAAYLGHLVALYRAAIDAYYASPPTYFTRADQLERLHRGRARPLSALTALGAPSTGAIFDVEAGRETLMLSDGAAEERVTLETINAPQETPPADAAAKPDLAVCVAGVEAARAALDGGADRIYLAAEAWQSGEPPWDADAMERAADLAREAGAMAALRTPRITSGREWDETAWLLERLAGSAVSRVLAGHYGLIELIGQAMPAAAVAADFSLNVLNGTAADLLAELGCVEAAVSVEASVAEIAAIRAASATPLEVVVHGPVAGMVLEHCLIAAHAAGGGKDVCRGPCQHVRFALRDRAGEVRPIFTDQYCRNHYLAARELCGLGLVGTLRQLGLASLRIEGQYYTRPADVGAVTRLYRDRLDGSAAVSAEQFARLGAIWPGGQGLGALARGVVRSEPTARVAGRLKERRRTH